MSFRGNEESGGSLQITTGSLIVGFLCVIWFSSDMEMLIECLQQQSRVCGTFGKIFCGALSYINNLITKFIQNLQAHLKYSDPLLKLWENDQRTQICLLSTLGMQNPGAITSGLGTSSSCSLSSISYSWPIPYLPSWAKGSNIVITHNAMAFRNQFAIIQILLPLLLPNPCL